MKNKPLTVLWFGGGQDSTALLYLYAYSQSFRDRYVGDSHFVVVMSDTGNEFPETYSHIREIEKFCKIHQINFFFLRPEMGYHGRTWQSLQGQMERNDNIFSVALPKSCTDNLKIKVCYAFLEDYLKQIYGFDGKSKKGKLKRRQAYYQYFERFGKLRSLIGFAKGEESRCAEPAQLELFPDDIKDDRPKWMKRTVQHIYPLIEMKLDRAGCQDLIADYGHRVPIPSNCMMCPFQNEAEVVYLHRFHPKMWAYWVEREAAKLLKNVAKTRNLGVKGEKMLLEFLENAKLKYDHWGDEDLIAYRNSHGHCVKSKY